MAETTVRSCSCVSEFQDKLYGSNQRVFNLKGVAKNGSTMRCTVCSTEK